MKSKMNNQSDDQNGRLPKGPFTGSEFPPVRFPLMRKYDPSVETPWVLAGATSSGAAIDTSMDRNPTDDFLLSAIGAGVITLVTVGGTIFLVAGALNIVTWAIGGLASLLAAIAPWAAVILGIGAYSAFSK